MAKNPDVDLKTISELAGHSSVELTAKYYIHSSKEEKINAVESLSFFWNWSDFRYKWLRHSLDCGCLFCEYVYMCGAASLLVSWSGVM